MAKKLLLSYYLLDEKLIIDHLCALNLCSLDTCNLGYFGQRLHHAMPFILVVFLVPKFPCLKRFSLEKVIFAICELETQTGSKVGWDQLV